uniref:Uncharacterized protein n=1 Tax=Quercus lobata TaxID=97700 RepID=A0A7N2LSG4_QUELO
MLVFIKAYNTSFLATISIVIPGCEIPRWFSHQSAGTTVNAQKVAKLRKAVMNGAGPSGEGSSNDVPQSKRIPLGKKDIWLMAALTMVTLIASILSKVVQDYCSISTLTSGLSLRSHTHSQQLLKESQAVLSLKAFTGQIWYCWRHFLCYMSQDCFFNIKSKVHQAVLGRNSPSLNGEDHHLVSQSNSKARVYRLAKANG